MENLIKGSLELNKMFAALARTADGLRRDFGEVENLQQSLKGARDFVVKAAARIEESILSDLLLARGGSCPASCCGASLSGRVISAQ